MKEFVEKLIERLEEKRMEYFLTMANTGDEKIDFVYENIGDLIDSITVIVNILAEEYNQDSTKKNQEWILCSERLPEEESNVLITTKAGNVMVGLYTKKYGFGMKEGFICTDCFMYLESVIAWQPLPEPYKTEKNNKQISIQKGLTG